MSRAEPNDRPVEGLTNDTLRLQGKSPLQALRKLITSVELPAVAA